IDAKTDVVAYTYHYYARIQAEECEKIDFVYVTPQINVESSTIPAESAEALLSDHNPQVVDLEF
ncbi:MAG: endonuclease, partial [Rikenellaceae bacterium]|nr:endonuclease [Rikenellaceae bacterium]